MLSHSDHCRDPSTCAPGGRRAEEPVAVAVKLAAQRLADAVFASPGAAPSAARLHRLVHAEERAREALVAPLKTLATRQEPVRPSHAADPGTNSKQHVRNLSRLAVMTSPNSVGILVV